MFVEPARSDQTIARYQIEATKFIGQYCREHPAEACHAPHESRVVIAVLWFLSCDGRWSESYIRLVAAALGQLVELFVMMELIRDNPESEKSLLWRLKYDRPKPAEKIKRSQKSRQVARQKQVAAKRKKRAKLRKSIPMRELRSLIRYFRSKRDEFSHWIVGYIILASRVGWRPGEILVLEREGNILRADAEKRSNQRGLADNCEIDISIYFEKSGLIKKASLASELDKWIANTRKWHDYGRSKLQDNVNSRLATACKKLKIKRVCTYTFRHFAISCLKASGFSRAEIAVIVNHATDRTATEHYGKRRHGFKRAKKMLSFNKARLPLVRAKARHYCERGMALSMNPY
ncbi:integrase [Bradyrhizobium sp. AZCC 1578]|uniref:hypothetical protein n=1 Tax=unclassified Bradyrhizobium TaxID=2631580 RepID=UPI002FF14C7C